MKDDPSTTPRERGLVMTATATVTLAVGITLAALLGHLPPPAPTAAVETISQDAPRVVLVPVQPAAPSEVPASSAAVVPARRREHHERSHREHARHERGEEERFDG